MGPEEERQLQEAIALSLSDQGGAVDPAQLGTSRSHRESVRYFMPHSFVFNIGIAQMLTSILGNKFHLQGLQEVWLVAQDHVTSIHFSASSTSSMY